MRNFPQIVLRQHLRWLRARYDGGAMSPGVFATLKTIETEIAWYDHVRHTNPRIRTDNPPTAKGENRHGY